jgi:hypothetical protein
MKDDVQVSEEQEERRSLATQYNCKLIKNYLKKSRVTVAALAVVWVVYIFECLYTWIVVSTAYGVANIPAITLWNLGGNVAYLVKQG